jgi:hypothetical protein
MKYAQSALYALSFMSTIDCLKKKQQTLIRDVHFILGPFIIFLSQYLRRIFDMNERPTKLEK